MFFEEKDVESRKSIDITRVTQQLIHYVLSMPARERLDLLRHIEALDFCADKKECQLDEVEQRISERIEHITEVDFVVRDKPYKGVSLDVSEDGIRITSCDVPDLGSELCMAFKLPGRSTYVRMKGVVVRNDEKEFGVFFHKNLNPVLRRYGTKIVGYKE